MKNFALLPALEKMNAKVFFLCLFIFQVLFIFQGLDLADEGFYGIIYQQIYKNPESVQFGFMYWLSGIIGGAFVWLFSGFGLLGIRIAGVMVTTAIIILTYNLLKKYLNRGNLKLGLILLVLLNNNNPKEIYYNNLSALFYTIIVYFLFTGLKEDRNKKIIAAGSFAALSFFLRLPNLLSFGLVGAILFYGFLNKVDFKKQFHQVLFFTGGYLLTAGAVLLVMKLTGHLPIFYGAIKLVASMGSGGTKSQYGITNLVSQYYHPYVKGVKTALFLFFIFTAPLAINFLLKRNATFAKKITGLVHFFIFVVLCYLVIERRIDTDLLVFLFCGMSLLFSVLIILTSHNKDIKVLMALGCFILVVYPFGSSSGLFTVGIYTLWVAFPIAIDYLFGIKSVNNGIELPDGRPVFPGRFIIYKTQLNGIRNWLVGFLMAGCLYYSWYYPYFDRKDRLTMHYAIENKYLKGIYTSKERADLVNGLLQESAKYIRPDDLVLAYDCMPMFHYATATRPYMRNPWPYLYPADVFKRELDNAEKENNKLPVVVVEKIKTIGSGSNWPDSSTMHDAEWENRNKERNQYLDDFLERNHYREIWNNRIFRIFIPADSALKKE